MTQLTISIVNHNSVDPLVKLLERIYPAIDGIPTEIFVVDNLCEERAQSELKTAFPEVKVISNSRVLGFSSNHNQVLGLAEGDYCLVINPDVDLDPASILQMLNMMEQYPRVAVCGPLIIQKGSLISPPKKVNDPLRDAILFCLYISNAKPQLLENLLKIRNHVFYPLRSFRKGPNNGPFSKIETSSMEKENSIICEVVSGACMLFRRRALQDVGLFDEDFFLYFEENDWCIRAAKKGWQIRHCPQVIVFHQGGTSTQVDYMKYLGIFIQSGLRFHKKHNGPWVYLLLKLILTFCSTWNCVFWSILLLAPSSTQDQLRKWRRFNGRLLAELWQSAGSIHAPA